MYRISWFGFNAICFLQVLSLLLYVLQTDDYTMYMYIYIYMHM